MSARQQIKLIADYIMANVPGEPSRDEGAGRCAVRLLTKYRAGMSASEAIYGFASWLTTRPERIVISSKDDAGVMADLVVEFCKVNDFAEPRVGWAESLVHPAAPGEGQE